MIKTMTQKVAAGFVIFRNTSANRPEFLMLQTSYGEHHWTPPKGHVDPGETDELVTAYRETEEESGLLKQHLKVFTDTKQTLNYLVNGKPKVVIYWLAELADANAKVKLSEEHQDYEWLNIEKACEYGKYEDMKRLLLNYNEYILKNYCKCSN